MRAQNSYLSFSGVVVGSRAFGESGRFIDILTHEYGRISVVGRGARASKKRFVGALDLFITLDIEVRTRKRPWTLESANIKNPRLGIRENLEAFKRAQMICDVVRSCAHENMPITGFYDSVERAFDLLAEHRCVRAVEEYPQLLKNIGIFPRLSSCERCGGAAAAALMEYERAIQPVCLSCDAEPVSGEALKVLKGESCSTEHAAKRIEDYVLDCLEEYLGRGLKTRRICAAL